MSNGITPIVQESRLSGGGGVGGTRSAGSSGIGSDSAATPPPYQPHHSLAPRPSRPTRDSSSDDDWAGVSEEPDYLGAEPTSVSLPRVARSPERSVPMPCKPNRQLSPALHQQQHHHLQNGSRSINHIQPQQQLQQVPGRRSAEHRQRSPSPIQYRSRTTATGVGQQHQQSMDPALMLASPRERFHDAKELFRQMEREAGSVRPIVAKINSRTENSLNCRPQLHRSEPVSRQSSHEEPPLQAEPNPRLIRSQHQFGQSPTIQTSLGTGAGALNGCHSQQQHQHERLVRRGAVPHHLDRQQQHQQLQPLTEQQQQQHISPEIDMQQGFNRNGRTKPRAQHFAGPMHHELEQMRPRPRSFYEVPMAARELRGPRNPNDGVREARDFSRALQPGRDRQHPQQQQRPRPFTYGELAEHERYPGLDRENARPPLEIGSGPARYRHSYAEPPRLGLAALHPY